MHSRLSCPDISACRLQDAGIQWRALRISRAENVLGWGRRGHARHNPPGPEPHACPQRPGLVENNIAVCALNSPQMILESVSDFLVCCQVICRTDTSLHKNQGPASRRRPVHRFPGLQLPVADAVLPGNDCNETSFLHVNVWDLHQLTGRPGRWEQPSRALAGHLHRHVMSKVLVYS